MQGYFFVGDLLGFAKLASNLSMEELSKRYKEWGAIVEEAKKHAKLEFCFCFSDTVFAATPFTKEGLQTLLIFARDLLNLGVRKYLPVRGGISWGDYEWEESHILGSAVVKSYKIEQMQDWIGVVCDHSAPHADELFAVDSLVCYPFPMKGQSMRLWPVLVWNIPSGNELVKFSVMNGLTKKGEELNWDWGRKISNTLEFKLYLRLLTQKKLDPRQFYETLPLIAIETQLTEGDPL